MKPMLAGKLDESKLRFPLIVQPKLDGIRACVVDGKLVSRTLKPIPNNSIRAALEQPEFEGFDGELIVGSPTADNCYRRTTSFVMADDKTGEPWTFYVFDLWNSDLNFEDRWTVLDSRLRDAPPLTADAGRLAGLTINRVINREELTAAEAGFVDAGYEGAILRGPKTTYKFGRGNMTKLDLIKLKRFRDSEARIIGVYEEEHNANVAFTNELGRTARSSAKAGQVGKGTLGGLIVRKLDTGVEFRIGTGFNAQERRDFWADRENLLDRIAKFKYFPVGEKDKPRHPVFLGFRDPIDIGG